MPIRVREASLADADIVIEFNRLLALESEGKALDLELLIPGATACLADPGLVPLGAIRADPGGGRVFAYFGARPAGGRREVGAG